MYNFSRAAQKPRIHNMNIILNTKLNNPKFMVSKISEWVMTDYIHISFGIGVKKSYNFIFVEKKLRYFCFNVKIKILDR